MFFFLLCLSLNLIIIKNQPSANFVNERPLLPSHQPKMPDSINLLLRNAIYLGIKTDCLFEEVDGGSEASSTDALMLFLTLF